MLRVLDTTTETEETPATPTLDDLAREGARRMLMAALQVEGAQYVDAYQEARDASGRRLVVRHGHRPRPGRSRVGRAQWRCERRG